MNTDFIYNKLVAQTGEADSSANNSEVEEALYIELFNKTQAYIVTNKLSELIQITEGNNSDAQAALRELIYQYLKSLHVLNDTDKITQRIFDDMTGFGFLNKYFADRDNIEEININSWDSIEVRYIDGSHVMIDEHFNSPQHSKDVILRILQQNNKYLDENNLIEISYIGKSVRIATTIAPICDGEAGIAASIRFIHSQKHTKCDLIDSAMMSAESYNALYHFLSNGISICFCGGTGAGKTTVCNALLRDMNDEKRIITLEAGTREFDLIKKDETGKTINSVVHLQTRPHKDAGLNVSLQTLLDLILKFDPDIVVVGEMVSEEAFIAQETARTGHTVTTTIHTNNAYDAYYKMYTLGIRKYQLDEKIMLKFMTDAFPIIVYVKLYNDNKRRVQTILEGTYENGEIVYNELYRYRVEDNIIDPVTGKTKEVKGVFEKANPISKSLRQRLLNNGLPREVVDTL